MVKRFTTLVSNNLWEQRLSKLEAGEKTKSRGLALTSDGWGQVNRILGALSPVYKGSKIDAYTTVQEFLDPDYIQVGKERIASSEVYCMLQVLGNYPISYYSSGTQTANTQRSWAVPQGLYSLKLSKNIPYEDWVYFPEDPAELHKNNYALNFLLGSSLASSCTYSDIGVQFDKLGVYALRYLYDVKDDNNLIALDYMTSVDFERLRLMLATPANWPSHKIGVGISALTERSAIRDLEDKLDIQKHERMCELLTGLSTHMRQLILGFHVCHSSYRNENMILDVLDWDGWGKTYAEEVNIKKAENTDYFSHKRTVKPSASEPIDFFKKKYGIHD